MKVVAAVWFFQTANYLDRVAMSFAGPSIMKSLSMEPNQFGIVLSAFGVGYFLAQIPGGLLADRWGAKPLMVIAPLFWALFGGATGFVATLAGFVLTRACLGVSEGMSNASCYKVIGDNFESRDRARAVGIWATAFAVAPALAGPIVGTLLVHYGWQAVFFFMMAPALIAAFVNSRFIPATPLIDAIDRTAPDKSGSFVRILRTPSLWVLSLAYFGFNIAYWGYIGWMPSYLALERHIDVKSIGVLGGIPYVFAFFGMLLAGWLGSTALYRYRPQLVAVFYVCGAVSLYFAYGAETLPSTLTGLSFAAFFLYGGFGPFGAIILECAPEGHRAAYAGVISTVGQVAGAVAPAIVGALVETTGTFASGFSFMIAGLCVASACLMFVTFFRFGTATPVVAAI
ncbi:MAG: MFS transporter [Beijerinckiaceae bacterium]|nr:MFS transporter [Beijerinckiaceae bacterium]